MFRGEDVYKEIKKLSGGERARVELVKLILKEVNFLLLDEPTNHLDLNSREALEKALSEYDGTLLAVSHDRYFMNCLATRIIQLTPDGVQIFDGNYDDYLKKIRITKQTEEKPEKGLDYREQKRLASEKRKLENKLTRTEEQIEKTEAEIDALNAEMEKPELALDYVKISELSETLAKKTEELETFYEVWEKTHQELEEYE